MPTTSLPYAQLATAAGEDDGEGEDGEEEGSIPSSSKRGLALSASDKWHIVKPLLMRYMLPLCKSTP